MAEDSTVPYTVMFNNFESTVGSRAPAWSALDIEGSTSTAATVSFATTDVRTRVSHARSLRVTNRDAAADGTQMTIPTTLLTAGQAYTISAWVYVDPAAVLFNPANPVQARVRAGSTLLTAAPGTDLTLVPGTFKNIKVPYTHVATNTTLSIAVGNTLADFYLDDVMIASTRAGSPIVAPGTLKETLDYPVGVAIEQRSTLAGTEAETVLTREFNSATPENAMKPESWYGSDRKFAGSEGAQFTSNAAADAIMDWAYENGGQVYGHVLVWHSQVPSWFFQTEGGQALSAANEEDKQLLRDRMRDHIYNIAEYLADRHGEFGSPTNRLVAFDVVNEVVADNAATASNGLRTSSWYNILGEEFIDLAFQYADEAFNVDFAAEGAVRPVKLFINEYGTEGGDGPGTKLQRYQDLIQRLIDRDVPIDGIGNQFHVQLTRDVNNLRIAMEKQKVFGLLSAVTEFDVTTAWPVTERLLVRQGHYYKAAFDIFNQYHVENPGKLFCVTIWGLHDAGSWLYYSGAPTMFDDFYQPKWSLVGALGGDIPQEPQAMNVFGGTVELTDAAASDPSWNWVNKSAIGTKGELALRWTSTHLTAYVAVDDLTVDATDAVTFTVGSTDYSLGRDGTGIPGVILETDSGYVAVAHVPLSSPAQGSTLAFTASIIDGATTTGWNSPGVKGELTLLEPLSAVAVVEAPSAPAIDGEIDAAWELANTVRTNKQINGSNTAKADIRTLWSGDGSTLYVLAEVTDPVIDTANANPWNKDSVEIFVDGGNAKNGTYRADDTQIRINVLNERSYGSGNAANQAARVQSAATLTDTGYRIEASIDLLTYGGPNTVHGLDFQVNDAANGNRIGVTAWADPTGNGFSSTARWGVGQLVPATPISFTDVPGDHMFATEIGWLAQQGITVGYEDGTFRPEEAVSRQATAAFLYRYAGRPAYTAPATAQFSDVPTDHPFYKEISWLAEQGVTTGYADGTFRPEEAVSRQAMAAFLYRTAAVTGPDAPAEPRFTDVPNGAPFATEIEWLASVGITVGYADGTFRPLEDVSRQAMAAFLYRFNNLD